jgi:sulfoxide reductase heme-binding subunit YedZ
MRFLTQRSQYRLLRHHLSLALVCGALISLLYSVGRSVFVSQRLSLATGYLGLALLGATLVIGALNLLRGRPNPVSTDLRRDVGIWCGVISLAHVVIGLQVHMGNMLLYFFRRAGGAKHLVPRFDLFGFANYTGLIAALIIVLLLALSNDFSLRRLGSRRWKFLQRWNYAVIAFLVLHSVAYQFIEERQLPYVILFGAIVVTVLLIQVLGFSWHRRKRGNSNSPVTL